MSGSKTIGSQGIRHRLHRCSLRIRHSNADRASCFTLIGIERELVSGLAIDGDTTHTRPATNALCQPVGTPEGRPLRGVGSHPCSPRSLLRLIMRLICMADSPRRTTDLPTLARAVGLLCTAMVPLTRSLRSLVLVGYKRDRYSTRATTEVARGFSDQPERRGSAYIVLYIVIYIVIGV